MPSFMNGCWGHKPTGGLVPETGQFPRWSSRPGQDLDARRINTCGPIARHVDDLLPVLRIIAGPDSLDRSCGQSPLVADGTNGLAMLSDEDFAVDLSKVTVISIPTPGLALGPSQELQDAQQRAFENLLHDCRSDTSRVLSASDRELPRLRRGLDCWAGMLQTAHPIPFGEDLGVRRPLLELCKLAMGLSHHTLPALGYALLQKLGDLFPARRRRHAELGVQLRNDIIALLSADSDPSKGEHTVLLFPSYSEPAPPHWKPFLPPS
jgi:fatty acid amide hydrolase 2